MNGSDKKNKNFINGKGNVGNKGKVWRSHGRRCNGNNENGSYGNRNKRRKKTNSNGNGVEVKIMREYNADKKYFLSLFLSIDCVTYPYVNYILTIFKCTGDTVTLR